MKLSYKIMITIVLLALAGYIFFPEIELSEISDIELNREIPANAPNVEYINEDIIDSIITNSNEQYFVLHFWSLGRPCTTIEKVDVDNEILNNLNRVKYIPISFDLNAKNMIKALRLWLSDIGFEHDSYLLDYSFSFLDLKNEDNLLDFINELTNDKYDNIYDCPIVIVFDKNMNIVEERDSFIISDLKRLDNQ